MSKSKTLEGFFERWLRPLLSLKPKNVTEPDYFSQILNVNSRIIVGYRAKAPFVIEGDLWADDVPGRPDVSGERGTLSRVGRGDIVWARIDDTSPGYVDIEHKARMWRVSYGLWNSGYRSFLTPLMQKQEEL